MYTPPAGFVLSEENIELFEKTFSELNNVIPCTYAKNFNFEFNDFSLFSVYSNFALGPTIDINSGNENCFIVFVQIISTFYSRGGGRGNLNEFYTWGACLLKQNFGHVIIRPESIADKIFEFIHPVEIDFEDDKDFSNKFYVLADSNIESKAEITQDFRKAVLEIKSTDFVIEIINNRLIIGDKKLIDPDTALDFAIFLNKIVQH